MWQNAGRYDILKWVSPIQVGNSFIYDIWISPVTHDDVKRCPWLRKLPNQDKCICRIHDVKPEHCRAYPRSRKHAKETGCKGFDEWNKDSWNKKGADMVLLDKIPYSILIAVAVLILLAPFRPMPHVLEKLIMLKNGTLTKPIDIFDLFYHLLPIIVLLLKVYRDYSK
jgi:Fe-S-cluster containining protein